VKERCDAGFGVNNADLDVFLDFKYAIDCLGKKIVAERDGNLFDIDEEITDEDTCHTPMMSFPAIH
jgi:succinate dehydrogenase / fumarate reductase flavoprotein subunit